MPSFNRVIFAGHMTRDPALKLLPSQTAVCEFGLAANRKFKVQDEQREEVTFIDCAAFGKIAEVINQYCRKGKPILVEGRLKYDSWDDKQTGAKRSKLSVVVENFQFLGGADEPGQEQESPSPRRGSMKAKIKAMGPANQASPIEDQVFHEDDIPF